MSAHKILPRLWLGDRYASMDLAFLTQNNIQCVFNCTKNLPFHESILRKYRIPVDDNLQELEISHLGAWSPEIVYKVVCEYTGGHNILIHCHAGIQRSAAVTAMTLIALQIMNAPDAIAYVKEKRPVAFCPAVNFLRSIRKFDSAFHYALSALYDQQSKNADRQ